MGSYRGGSLWVPLPKDTMKRSLLLQGTPYRALKVHRSPCRAPQGELPRPTAPHRPQTAPFPIRTACGGAPHGPKALSRPHRPPHGPLPTPGQPHSRAGPHNSRGIWGRREGGRGISLTASPHSVPPPPFCLRRRRSAALRACAGSGRAAPAQNGGALPPSAPP